MDLLSDRVSLGLRTDYGHYIARSHNPGRSKYLSTFSITSRALVWRMSLCCSCHPAALGAGTRARSARWKGPRSCHPTRYETSELRHWCTREVVESECCISQGYSVHCRARCRRCGPSRAAMSVLMAARRGTVRITGAGGKLSRKPTPSPSRACPACLSPRPACPGDAHRCRPWHGWHSMRVHCSRIFPNSARTPEPAALT